jgi:hypothetical protein
MRVPDNRKLVIPETQRPREGWDKAFAGIADNNDDQLLDHASETMEVWDQEEWEW